MARDIGGNQLAVFAAVFDGDEPADENWTAAGRHRRPIVAGLANSAAAEVEADALDAHGDVAGYPYHAAPDAATDPGRGPARTTTDVPHRVHHLRLTATWTTTFGCWRCATTTSKPRSTPPPKRSPTPTTS
ncbi:MAG TPA: hypothetical protein VNQ73_02565 [Ilumatobacter sp.]|nr:hypothetical protein [Ilumatobacter sp.]